MKYLKVLSLLLTLILIMSCSSLKKSLDTEEFLKQKMKKARVVGLQAAILRNGKLVYKTSLGKLRIDQSELVNDSTLFMIASTSKPITALTVLKLIEEYDLTLDDDINKFLPFKVMNPKYPKEKITFRHLLTHTSTIKDNWKVLDSLYTLPKGGDASMSLKDYVYENLHYDGKYFNESLSFQEAKPSEHWEYANTGYALLGLLVEEISKKSFNSYSKENILDPLGVKNSYWLLRNIPTENITNPHEIKDDGHEVLAHYGYPTYPDGQLRTTVTDYSKFLELLLNNGKLGDKLFIKASTIKDFLKIQYPKTNKWQAIAWNYNEFENFIFYLHLSHMPAHTGGDPGIATAVMFDPESKGAVLLFLNTRLNDFKGVKAMYLDVLKRLSKEAGVI